MQLLAITANMVFDWIAVLRRNSAVLCFNLTQCDLGTPEGQKKFKDLGLHNLCSKFVQEVTLWVGETIGEKPGI